MLGPPTGHWGCSWLCGPGILGLLAAGHGNTEHGDLKDEGIPWCHIPVQLQPWLVQQCYSGGLYHCQGNVQHPLDLTWSHRSYHQQWHSLSFQVTTCTWMRMVSRAALLPSWLSFPSATDLGETHAICAGARKSLRGSLLAWLSPGLSQAALAALVWDLQRCVLNCTTN